jgi:hypothetical protein
MGDSSGDIRLRRKSLFLVADLAEQIDKLAGGQLDAILELELNSGDSMNLFNEGLLKTVVNLLDASDMDTQEKVGIYWLISYIKDSGMLFPNSLTHTFYKSFGKC